MVLASFAEARQLIRLARPLLAAQLLSTATGAVDTLMSGHYHADDLAAVAVGNSLWMPLYLLIVGLQIASTSLVARFYGAGDYKKIVSTVQQSLWMALAASVIVGLLLANCRPLLDAMQLAPALAEITSDYLLAIAFAMPAAAVVAGLRSFAEGMGRMRPFMFSSLLAFLINIPFNYALIYGVWGLPELGGAGCGWATALSMWIQALVLGCLTSRARQYAGVRLFSRWQRPRLAAIGRILRLGLPIAVAVFAEVSIFSMIALLLAPLGALVVAGHQIALTVSHMVFMLPLSLSQAITIRVGHYLGAGRQREANVVCRTGIVTAMSLSAITASLILWFDETLVGWFTSDADVQRIALSLFVLMAIYQFPDHVQISANASLRAYHDTRVPMALVLMAYWMVALPLGFILARTDWLLPAIAARGFWVGLVVGLSLSSIALTTRLYRIASRPLSVPDR